MEPELNINDLWKVWQWDEKVNENMLRMHCAFLGFRLKTERLFMLSYSVDPAEDQKAEPDASFPENAVLSV